MQYCTKVVYNLLVYNLLMLYLALTILLLYSTFLHGGGSPLTNHED